MHNQRDKNRIWFIDYLRGFMVLLVVMDHSMHAYSPHYKKFWYFPDFGGTLLFDIWHMHNDAIMMPLLFFLAGMFVLPSLKRRGLLSFSKEKFYRLVVPFIFGVAIIVPPQKYIAAIIKKNLDQPYLDYWVNTYFWSDLATSAFWFLYYLAVLTALLVIIHMLIPSFMTMMGKFVSWLFNNPVKGFITFALIGALTISASEVIWSSQYWVSFWKLFNLRGSRFIIKAIMFFLGAGFAHAGITRDQKTLTRIGDAWKTWVTIAVISGTAYISYALMNFHSGAYTLEILRHFHFGGSWADVWPIINAYGWPLLTRASLLGIFMCSLVVMYVSVFRHFLDKASPKWQSLAACSFGIYIFHEPLVMIIQYQFYQADTSEYIKFIAAAGFATVVSWALTHVIKDLPGIKKVL